MAARRNGMLPILRRGQDHGDRVAVIDAGGASTYRDLVQASERVAHHLQQTGDALDGARIGILVSPGFPFIAAMWGIWRVGGIAVPLALSHPEAELAYVVEDCGINLTITADELAPRLAALVETTALRLVAVEEAIDQALEEAEAGSPEAGSPEAGSTPAPVDGSSGERGALILYTSGTTGRPKGVVLSHDNLRAQIENLVSAWQWSAEDHILEVLPLHHVHGLINIIGCALWSGATCEILPRFDAERIWQIIRSGRLTLFMAVPTIYVRLIQAWEAAEPELRAELSRAAASLRLMVSGSAALPVPVLDRWREITGHTLLERYGMTEIGMALSNPYDGTRVPGAVGSPLPSVDVRLIDDASVVQGDGRPGEIEVRGPTVFERYWQRPEATREAFRDGWFQTGDLAVRENGCYRILGRQSIDIIKCGGEKISALEIETVLLAHPRIDECAVVGVEDAEWGQRVAAALVLAGGGQLGLEALRDWAKQRLARFKVPSRLLCVDSLPRNAMGKVTKPAVVELFETRRQA
ncbi:MAG: acyl-CoA synthetase [Acidobacteriota bacterium]